MIRPAQAADARAIAELQIRVWHRNWADFADPVAVQTADVREARWNEWLTDPGAYVWDQGGSIAGIVATMSARDADLGPGYGEFGVLMVDPPAQGNGIGGSLHDHAIEKLRDEGFTDVAHWVFVGNDHGVEFLTDRGWAHDGATGERHTLAERRFVRTLSEE